MNIEVELQISTNIDCSEGKSWSNGIIPSIIDILTGLV